MTRHRSPLPVLFLVGFITLLVSAAALAQTVRAVDAVGVTVSDIEVAGPFPRADGARSGRACLRPRPILPHGDEP